MDKHVVIVSEESVLAGYFRCGVGEVVDTMAEALRSYCKVSVITPGTSKRGQPGGTVCLGVTGAEFYTKAAALVNEINPDVVHNFGRADFIDRIQVAGLKVLSFDQWDDLAGQEEHAGKYDRVVTLSRRYAEEMTAEHPEVAAWPLEGIINGIDGIIYGGYRTERGKARREYYRNEGRTDSGKKILVYMGRLEDVKGIDHIIEAAPTIAAAGGELVVYGVGRKEYEEQLEALHRQGTMIYRRRLCNYGEMMRALRAADFYLAPSHSEVCGLQAMKAARLGCVPIVSMVGGLAENFDADTAVIITESLATAAEQALKMTDEEYAAMRNNCVKGAWTWDTRILPWLELYGIPAEPRKKQTETVENPTEAVRKIPFARRNSNE